MYLLTLQSFIIQFPCIFLDMPFASTEFQAARGPVIAITIYRGEKRSEVSCSSFIRRYVHSTYALPWLG